AAPSRRPRSRGVRRLPPDVLQRLRRLLRRGGAALLLLRRAPVLGPAHVRRLQRPRRALLPLPAVLRGLVRAVRRRLPRLPRGSTRRAATRWEWASASSSSSARGRRPTT